MSNISINKRVKYLGTFDTEKEAHEKYMEECQKIKELGL
jgi:hypothetical protein